VSRLYSRPLRIPPADKLIDQLVPKLAAKTKESEAQPFVSPRPRRSTTS